MSFIARLQRAREILAQQGRLSIRALERELEIGGDELVELVEELVDVQQVARREGKILVWAGTPAARPSHVTIARALHAATPPPAADHGLHPSAADAADQVEARKVVTIIFADLARSTALHERLDPESVRRFMERYYRAMCGAVEAHDGTVVKLLGDGVMAAFGVPHVAEDDAIRAVRAGVGMQEAFRILAREHSAAVGDIGLRVAINTGEVVVSADNTDVVGDPVNVAARLQQEAHDGDVVLGEPTRRLVAALLTLEPLGRFALKGRAETVKAYRVVSFDRPAGAATAAFVGRDEELARIITVYEAALAKPAGRLAVLLGSPGLGKSRLIEEVTRRLGDAASVVTAHCDAAGGATFAPVAAALREFFHIEAGASPQAAQAAIAAAIPAADAERTRIAGGIAALLAGSPASPEETFFVIRRLLAGLAAATPVVLVIDDLQWAEPLLLDLVEHLVQWGGGVPLLVLVGARPELRDLRSSLVTPGGLVADVVTLSGLDAGAAMRLAANVIGASDLPAAVAAKVLATSEGNPLFVGELVRMLVDEGAIERRGERWIVGANLASLEMPPTIHALLAARIERLRPEERSVLERAAVVGRHFSRSAVAALLGRNGTELDARLEALRRTELIERDTGWFLGEPVLRFHHVLIRDAAYRRLLKGTRAELHEQLADWIEAQVQDAPEHDETIGWHLEQAHQHLRELGRLDAKGRSLGERAAARLAAAGRRALARDDVPLAASLLGRAVERLDSDDPSRADLALDWCEALLSTGDVVPAAKAIDELGRLIETSVVAGSPGNEFPGVGTAGDATPRLRAWHTCFAGQLTVMTAPQKLQATTDAVAAAAEELAKLGDAAGEAKAHSVHAQALARLGRVGACEAALDKALAAARKAGDRRRANAVLAGAPLAALWGPSPVTRASGRCLDVVRVLRITQGAPAVEAVALNCQGVLEALRGRTDAARRMIASSRKMVEELGIAHRLFEANVFAGRIDLLEGDAAAAERNLRGAYEGLRELGLGIDAACAGALLARSVLAQDRAAEAETLSYESEALAGDDLQAAIAWRGVRAEALAQRGEHGTAVDLAKAAVAIAAATDALLDHADARLALAAALRSAGRAAEADAEERRAIELWEAKGATLLAERARQKTGRAAPVAPELATRAEPIRGVQRRIRANAASTVMARIEAAFAARDLAAIDALLGDRMENVDHPTGSTYGREAQLDSSRRMLRIPDLSLRNEPLATLGESLCLCRRLVAARGTAGGHFDVAEYEMEHIGICERDEVGRLGRLEVFAPDHLGDAIGRFYERYAELLPDGPERDRAAATARSLAALLGPFDLDRFAIGIAPALDFADHRHVGLESSRGADAWLRGLRSLLEVADGVTNQVEDILGLRPDVLLAHWRNFGTDRAGGGAYERHVLWLGCFGPDGLLARIELFEVQRHAEALARFDELVAGAEPWADSSASTGASTSQPSRRGVRPNAATRNFERFGAAVAARDGDQLVQTFGEPLQVVHHPTGAMYGRREMLGTWRSAFRAERLARRQELLATLGDALALGWHWLSVEGLADAGFTSFGPAELEEIVLFEVDDLGRSRHMEIFAADRLGAAVARLYERYAELLPDGAARVRVAATAHSVAAMTGFLDHDRMASAVAPAIEVIDHRILGTWSARGADALLQHVDAWLKVGDAHRGREDDILALQSDALLLKRTFSGTDREGGGAFDGELIVLWVFGNDGRATHWEMFDADREAEALARFDALAGGGVAEPAPEPFENAASLADSTLFRCFNVRDWAGVLDCVAPELVFDERRRMVRNTCGREIWLEQFRLLLDVPASRFTSQLLATRGARLSLNLHCFEGEVADGGGPLAMDDHLALHEVDGAGRIVAIVLFDLEDADAAYTELDARFAAGEGAAHPPLISSYARAIASRDWDAIAALYPPTFLEHDHRAVALLGTTRGPEAWMQDRALLELAPDTVVRFDHVRHAPRGFLSQVTWQGSHDGARYEIPFVIVTELDEDGKPKRNDLYDPEQLDQARARFAELAATTASSQQRFANAATATVDPVIACMVAHDWRGFERLFSEDFRCSDRRRVVQLELDRDRYVAFTRQVADGRTIRGDSQVIATRGDRLALTHSTFEFTDGDVGPSEIAFVILTQVNDCGRIVAYVRWDLEDLDAAYAELDARWEAGEDAAHVPAVAWRRDLRAALDRRDWDAVAACYAPAFVGHDHRLASWGTLRGPAAFLEVFRAMLDLAPDARLRWNHLRTLHRGMIDESVWVGTRDGGAFESPFISVLELDAHGKALRFDFYDPHHLDRAQARFEEIGAGHARDPLAAIAKPNAASAWLHRFRLAFNTRDWDALRALFASQATYEDRQRRSQPSGGVDMIMSSVRERAEAGARLERVQLLGTAGSRVAIQRVLWPGGGAGGRFETELIVVQEVDEAGQLVATINFDPDDARDAQREAWARWAAIDPAAAAVMRLLGEQGDAFNAHDWIKYRAVFADDLIVEDHRHTGMGRIDGADAYVASVVALWELAPESRVHATWHWPACDRHGAITVVRRTGTVPGGGDFESEYLHLCTAASGRVTRVELFELDDLDAALARFAELRPDPLRIPPNAATRWNDRWCAFGKARDWEALRALFAPNVLFDDRRRLLRTTGDRETALVNGRLIWESGRVRLDRTLLATTGDRLALERWGWRGGDPGADFEINLLALTEVGADGLVVAWVCFDPDDRAAASAELIERYVHSGAGGVPAAAIEFARAWNDHDLGRLRALLPGDYFIHDHRRTGIGRVEGADTYIASLSALYELSRDVRLDPLYLLAVAEHGFVSVNHFLGTNAEGGEFESVFVGLSLYRGERLVGFELFELEDLDAALARFEELCAPRAT